MLTPVLHDAQTITSIYKTCIYLRFFIFCVIKCNGLANDYVSEKGRVTPIKSTHVHVHSKTTKIRAQLKHFINTFMECEIT